MSQLWFVEWSRYKESFPSGGSSRIELEVDSQLKLQRISQQHPELKKELELLALITPCLDASTSVFWNHVQGVN
ncbi:unnamed protein product [Calypogeia fissa]